MPRMGLGPAEWIRPVHAYTSSESRHFFWPPSLGGGAIPTNFGEAFVMVTEVVHTPETPLFFATIFLPEPLPQEDIEIIVGLENVRSDALTAEMSPSYGLTDEKAPPQPCDYRPRQVSSCRTCAQIVPPPHSSSRPKIANTKPSG